MKMKFRIHGQTIKIKSKKRDAAGAALAQVAASFSEIHSKQEAKMRRLRDMCIANLGVMDRSALHDAGLQISTHPDVKFGGRERHG